MSVPVIIIIGVLMGLVFGFALEKGRVFEPGVIVGQMQLRNFTMLKMFLSAVATTAIVLIVLTTLFDVSLHPKATHYYANIAGGLLLGLGMVLSGACPGTVLAQVGAGYKDAWFTIIGGLAGAFTYGVLYPSLKPIFFAEGPGKITLHEISGMPYGMLAGVLAVLCLAIIFALEKFQPWRDGLGNDLDGAGN